jgi:hypothetical protein
MSLKKKITMTVNGSVVNAEIEPRRRSSLKGPSPWL